MKKIIKAHVACLVLSMSKIPLSRFEILEAVAKLEGKPYKRTSNSSYFVPAFTDTSLYVPYSYNENVKRSWVCLGYIEVTGKRGNTFLYSLTPKGLRMAKEAKKLMKK